jgi:hypothetical protein
MGYGNNSLFSKYQREEIFNFNSSAYNNSDFVFEEIKSPYLGRCYMVCYIKEVQKKVKISFPLWKKVDMTGENKARVFQ